MRRAAIAAFVLAAISATGFVALALAEHLWIPYLDMAVAAVIPAGLGYLIGWRHQSWAAAALIAYVLIVTAMRILSGGRSPALLFVAVFVWLFYEGFQAAREYVALRDVPLEPTAPPA